MNAVDRIQELRAEAEAAIAAAGDTAELEALRVTLGIDNLTDEEPEVVGATATNNALGSTTVNYDPFGRRYFVGLSMSF